MDDLTSSMPYICAHCGHHLPSFHLTCPECGAWSSLNPQGTHIGEGDERPVALSHLRPPAIPRLKSGIGQLDDLLGGGVVAGSSMLITGEPGAGKSTLVLQLLNWLKAPSLYVTGEESLRQLKLRADRLNIRSHHIFLLYETNIAKIAAHIREAASKIVVIDSMQTIYTDLSDALSGSPTQIRKCIYILRRLAHEMDLVLIVIGQVTKSLRAAGPMLLEHAVDVVLSLECDDAREQWRTLHAIKNRFGSTVPRCTLTMRASGLLFPRSARHP